MDYSSAEKLQADVYYNIKEMISWVSLIISLV